MRVILRPWREVWMERGSPFRGNARENEVMTSFSFREALSYHCSKKGTGWAERYHINRSSDWNFG